MPRFEFVGGGSSKFWEITLKGSSVQTRWGRIGAAGQEKDKPFDSAEEAQKAYDKLIESKLKEGYKAVEAQAPPAAVPKGKKAPEAKTAAAGGYLDVAGLESRFGIKLPKRMRKFIGTKEFLKYDKLCLSSLPNTDSESSEKTFIVSFDDPKNRDLLRLNDLKPDTIADVTSGAGFESCRSVIPLSKLGAKSDPFLAVQIDDEACPVFLFEVEAFYRCADSLDAFLATLYDKKSVPTRTKAIAALERAKEMVEEDQFQEALNLTTPQVLIGLGRTGWRGEFQYLRGKACVELGLRAEAESLLEGESGALLMGMYIVALKDYALGEKALRALEADAAAAPKEKRHWDDILHGQGMLALVHGDDAAAKKAYEALVEPLATRNYFFQREEKIRRIVRNLEALVEGGVAKAALVEPFVARLKTIKCTPDDYLEA